MINKRLDRGTLERCDSQYRNPQFLVVKKDGVYQVVNNAQYLNRVTTRDANLLPTTNKFLERFAGCCVVLLIDLFSGYD